MSRAFFVVGSTMFAEDDHPTQQSLPRVHASDDHLVLEDDDLDGPETVPSEPPSYDTFSSSGLRRAAERRSHVEVAPLTVPSPIPPAPRSQAPSTQAPTTRPRIPLAPRAPLSLATAPSIDFAASAALPLVTLDEDDKRATTRTRAAVTVRPADDAPLSALEREVCTLRTRLGWLTVLAVLSLGLSLALLAHLVMR